ncbi:SPOR domain-containing protein, partial [Thalassospira sp. UBA6510]
PEPEPEPATETADATQEAAPSAPAEDSAAATDADKPFSVQVGAFKVHENAKQRADELRGEGLEVAVVVRGPESEGAWYYVRIGGYASLAAARDAAAKIKADHSLDGFPVRAEPNDRVVD